MHHPLKRIADEIDSFLETAGEESGDTHGDATGGGHNDAPCRPQILSVRDTDHIGNDNRSLRNYLSLIQAQMSYLAGMADEDRRDAAPPRHEIACAVGETLEALIARADMTMAEYFGGEVAGTDGAGTFSVGHHHDNSWGDCVAVSVNREGERPWVVNHLSPARARIMASHLLRLAEKIEHDKGTLLAIDRRKKHF